MEFLKEAAEICKIKFPENLENWSKKNMVLNEKTSSLTGKWQPFPYQREMMNALTDPGIQKVTFLKSARIGYTKMITIFFGYIVDQEPSPVLIVQPTLDDAKGYSKDEIDIMIQDLPCLQNKIKEPKSRSSGSTILKKSFLGGALSLVGANAPTGFRRITVRFVFFDEIDAYPPGAGDEGDQIKLGEKRAVTYANKKFIYGSTPLEEGSSRIKKSYEESDMRKCYVPCPHCHKFQTLDFINLKWNSEIEILEEKIQTAHFVCKFCQKEIEEKYKSGMLEKCEWRAEKPMYDHAGFFIWSAYNPLISWKEIVKEFLLCKDNPEELKVFVNTVLGETWDAKTRDAFDWQKLYNRRDDYDRNSLPEDKNYILVAGADVQADRIEVEIVAYSAGMESWSVDYRVYIGKPEKMTVFQNLLELMKEQWNGQYIRRIGVDCGYASQSVYSWARHQLRDKVIILRGFEKLPTIVGQPKHTDIKTGKKVERRAMQYFPVSTSGIKSEIYSWLRIEEEGNCYFHFPSTYEEEYFKQLCAEYQKPVKTKTGYTKNEWVKIRERNEALDCRVYARAVAYTLGIDRFTPEVWQSGFEPSRRFSQDDDFRRRSSGSRGAGIVYR